MLLAAAGMFWRAADHMSSSDVLISDYYNVTDFHVKMFTSFHLKYTKNEPKIRRN